MDTKNYLENGVTRRNALYWKQKNIKRLDFSNYR